MEILIIEDDLGIVELVKESASLLFSEIIAVHSGKGAIEHLQSRPCSMMIMDYLLPDMDGLQLVENLKNENIDIPPFVVLTGQGDERVAVEMMKSGARDYIIKDTGFLQRLPQIFTRIVREIENETRRREAEQALKQSRELLQKIMLVSIDGIWDWDLRTNKVDFDARYFQLAGYEPNEFSNHFSEFEKRVHPDDIENVLQNAQDYISGKIDQFKIEFRFKTKDDQWLWIMGRGTIFERDEHGKPVRFIGTHSNIHERKIAEEKLLQAAQEWKLTFDASNDVIWLLDKDYCILRCNKQATQVFNLSESEIIGKNYQDILFSHEEDDSNAIHYNISTSLEYESAHIQIGEQWYKIQTDPILDSQKRYSGSIQTISDITKEKQYNEEIKKARDRAQLYFDIAGTILLVLDRNCNVLRINKKGSDILGYAQESIIGKQWFDHFSPKKGRRKLPYDFKLMINGNIEKFEHTENKILTKNGQERLIAWKNSLLYDNDKNIIGTLSSGQDITEARHAEKVLQESEEKYRRIVEFSPDGILTLNTKGYITSANRAFIELTGYSTSEVLHKHFTKLPTFIPQKMSTYFRLFSKVINHEQTDALELEWKKADGQVRIGEAKTRLLKENNKIVGLQAILRDITEKKQQQDAIRDSELKYRRLIQQSSDAIYVLCGARFEMVNRKFIEIFGYTEDVLLHPHFDFMNLIHPKSQAFILERSEKVAKGQHVNPSYEFTAVHKNGNEIECEVNVSYIKYNGKPATQGILRDISERKRRETELRKLSQAVEQSPASVIICNLSGNIEYVNKTFLDISGYTWHEVIGKNPRILNAGDTPPEIFIEMWETISNGKQWKGRFHNKKKSGELYWEQATISPIMSADGKITHYLGLKEDITEKLKLEGRFQQSQKMEAIGLLAGGIAHDFNNLLTVINGYSDLLLEDLTSDEEALDKIKEVRHAGERAASLTRQLLAFSRKQILKPEIVNLNDLIENMQKMLGRLIGEDIDLCLYYDIDLKNIFADPGQIEQILLNLIVNARDALPKGGKITIETTQAFLDNAYCQLTEGLKPGEHVIISIADNGIGMSKEVQDHVFEPFFTTKSSERGTGLGLSTVYGIVRQSGGDIKVYSEVGIGSTFKVILPTIDKFGKMAEGIKKTLQGGKETIFVVEDEEAVRRLVEHSLQSLGYHVISASDGHQALESIKMFKGKIDLLLSDVVMPQMSGKELAAEMSKMIPDLKICFMSGYTDNTIFNHEILHKELNFIQKPFTRYSLATTVRKILDS